ncbi:alpha/beta hydrolase-fold protein [Stutzerimonas kirkiae]|uniref:alpha/beta hydrolase-fold protein n=1 Tax=Stutzerimonas kirkiae TaxID=2211392 RepID=UPI001038543F|nr:alpha/beta hydrolase-fold protein [Stutzerimonas kirkiae]TBV14257.1 enterochelin esterase [Stutzerimonas kirkiae]
MRPGWLGLLLCTLAGSVRAELAPPLQQLREDASPQALERFFTQRQFPLRQRLENGDWRITFVWRAAPGEGDTRLLWPAQGINTRRFEELGVADIRYLSLEVPAGLRASYRFASDLPAFNGLPRERIHQLMHAQARPDPLNPTPPLYERHADAEPLQAVSLLELPGAVPQPWLQPVAPGQAGHSQRLQWRSDKLGNSRPLTLYTPPGYQAGRAYPLLVLFDEHAYTAQVPTAVILDNLIAAGEIPPMLAVMLSNPSRNSRQRELACNPLFADALAHELLPWLAARHRLSERASERILAGSSYGGLAAACAAYRYPGHFGAVLSQSGSFWWGPESEVQWLTNRLRETPRLPLRFYLDAGLLEGADARGILGSTRTLRQVLCEKGYPVAYQAFTGGHDYAAWRGTLADGLRALLGAPPERLQGCGSTLKP